jgi:fumarate hydratase class II
VDLFRSESDSFGRIDVPTNRLWGAQTQRSLAHFSISSERMPLEFVFALAQVKRVAAMVNRDLGLLAPATAAAIMTAAEEVLAGNCEEEFPLSIWQTGSGTHTNMNMNEVLANRASELLGAGLGSLRSVHPHEHVNLGQSSNDIFPTAMNVAAAMSMNNGVLPALHGLHTALADKATDFGDIVKIGRTHLQDATPLTLGQEFSGYASQLNHGILHLQQALPHVYELAVGGTAVGTGLNTHPEFGMRVCEELSRIHGLPFRSAPNTFESLASHDGLVHAHSVLKNIAASLTKIANDIRWLASGPRSGLGEISLPSNEPGSSIMPGKVNPTQAEALIMACAQIFGNDVSVNIAGASGNFELNVYKPLILHNFLQSTRLLTDCSTSFTNHCVVGILANQERIDALLQQSLMLVTALSPHIGYDKAAHIAHKAHVEGTTLREAALASHYVTAAQFELWVQAKNMTGTTLAQ